MMWMYFEMDEVTWSYITFVAAAVPWISYAFMLTFFVMSIYYGRFCLYKNMEVNIEADSLPGVTLLKPLLGVDPFLEVNLESHFNIKYPKLEILICVADAQDPAVELVNRIKQRYPHVDCKLYVGGGRAGIINPLIHNLSPAYEEAKYEVIWISTSRIKANTEILLDMITKLSDPRVALVHQMPFTTDQGGLAAAVEKVYFGASVAKYYLAFHMLGISCFTGMSYLVKKSHLDEVKGFSYFGRFLAEDYFLAKYLHNKGYLHVLSSIPAQQNVASNSVATYKDRMVRWLRLRLNMMPLTAGFLEPLGESVPLGVYAAWSAQHLFGWNPYLYFLCHWIIWFILDYIQFTGVQRSEMPFSFPMYVRAWIIRELLYLFVYVDAICNVRRIKWGKRTYYLSNFGESLQIVNDRPILPI